MVSRDGENLVFLLSLPRSGSTILSLLLGNHSAILCPPEPWFLLKLSTLTQPGNVHSAFDDEWATIGTNQFLQDDTFVEAARAFAATTYNRHLRAGDKSVLVDKTPRYYHILQFIEALFPKARKIWLQRNPLDVGLSYVNSWGVGIEIIVGKEVTTASFDFAIGPFNLAAYFDEASPYKLEVQYERLVRSPAATLADICRFLDIEFEEAMLDYTRNEAMLSQHGNSIVGDGNAPATSSVHSDSVGKWATELPPAEIQQIIELLGSDILRRMGYEDTVTTLQSLGMAMPSETKAAEARRRVGASAVDKTGQLYDQLATLRRQVRGLRAIALILKKTRIDRLLARLV